MLDSIKIQNVLFIDIETVSGESAFDMLTDRFQKLWKKKATTITKNRPPEEIEGEVLAQIYEERAAIYAEFGKIVCISIGYLHSSTQEFRVKSFAGHEEKVLLEDFADLLNKYYNDASVYMMCGHNIREFDVPYLCRRMVINGVALPDFINLTGKKPWETQHLVDTMHLWRFGDFKNFTSLDLIAGVLGVETPKDDIDGSMVGQVFWKENDLKRIAVYCEKDVVTVAQVLLRMKGDPLIAEHKVVSV